MMEIEPYVRPEDKPPAIIVDIDGTLAHHGKGDEWSRGHYDYGKVGEDLVDPVIRDLVDREWSSGFDILIVTGRPTTCYFETYRWLVDNHVPLDGLWMRNPNDKNDRGGKLEDWIVKLAIFDKHIRSEYRVEYVLEDRDQCVDMWRKLGLKCLQVERGDF